MRHAAVVADYERIGVVESARLGRIGDALGVTHFLQVRCSYLSEGVLGSSLFDDHELRTDERQELTAIARLWADRGGAPVWEAVGRTWSETGEFRTRREPYELVTDLVISLVEAMPVEGVAVASSR